MSPLDLLAASIECHELKNELILRNEEIRNLKESVVVLKEENKTLKEQLAERSRFGIESVRVKEEKIKGLFKYYTAITCLILGIIFFFNSTRLLPRV